MTSFKWLTESMYKRVTSFLVKVKDTKTKMPKFNEGKTVSSCILCHNCFEQIKRLKAREQWLYIIVFE